MSMAPNEHKRQGLTSQASDTGPSSLRTFHLSNKNKQLDCGLALFYQSQGHSLRFLEARPGPDHADGCGWPRSRHQSGPIIWEIHIRRSRKKLFSLSLPFSHAFSLALPPSFPSPLLYSLPPSICSTDLPACASWVLGLEAWLLS